MDKYQSLRIWSYQPPNEALENEYLARFKGVTTLKTGLYLNPISHGQRSLQTYELFLVPIPKILRIQDEIWRNSHKITNLIKKLSPVAFTQLFNQTLVAEIIGTNNIEGVKTTKQEVQTAIASVGKSEEKVRLQSFVRMYFKIKQQEELKINELADLRKLYDHLLVGEIATTDLPDGVLFRNSFVRIGNDLKTVHVPKSSEKQFEPDLLNWIKFVNAKSLPSLMKAFVAHYYFEYIHLFKDGNGRFGRYLTCVYLGHELDPLTAIIFSNEVDHERPKYYKAFIEVEEPKNHGEITFFVHDMMQILLQGQQKILTELEEKWQLLKHGRSQVTKDIDDPLMRKLVFLYLQAAIFKVANGALKDDEVKHYLKDEVWSKIWLLLDILTKRGILIKTKNAPLMRRLADNYLDKLLS